MEGFKSLEEIIERPQSAFSGKRVLGKKMNEARCKTRELEAKLKTIENKINHLNLEQAKHNKVSQISSQKNNVLSQVKDQHAKLKQEIIEWKISSDQAVNAKKRELSRLREERKASIESAKKSVKDQNRDACFKVKLQSRNNEAFINRYKIAVEDILKDQAQKMNKSQQIVKHTRNGTNQNCLIEKEQEYSLKLQKELNTHEELLKKIEGLAKTQESISQMMSSEENKTLYSHCAVLSERSPEKDDNITSIV